jgi:alanine racemase
VNAPDPVCPGPAPATLHIDLEALAANYAALVRVAGGSTVAGVVKANAYGLGVGPVAACLVAAGCRDFFVSSLSEGIELRSLQPAARIFVLEGATGATALCLRQRLVPVLNTVAEVEAWRRFGEGAPAALQIDTGMARAGLDADDVERLATMPGLGAALRLELVLTHLACADEPEHPLNRVQVERFATLRRHWPTVPVSIGNSAGTLLGPAYRGDLVRPGIALYGGRPFVRGLNPMREVVRLTARVLQLRDVPAGSTAGYGASWQARADARIATVGAGYADGYPRTLGNRGVAAIAGHRIPVVGRISMDLTTLDVTALPTGLLRVGDEVDLFGGGIPLEEAAELAGTVNYELIARLSTRVDRRYSDAVAR